MADCSCAFTATYIAATATNRTTAGALRLRTPCFRAQVGQWRRTRSCCMGRELSEPAVGAHAPVRSGAGDSQAEVVQWPSSAAGTIDDGAELVGLLRVGRRDFFAPLGEQRSQPIELHEGFELALAGGHNRG